MRSRKIQVATIVALWAVLGVVLHGKATQPLDASTLTPIQSKFGDWAAKIDSQRNSGFLFKYFFNPLRAFVDSFVKIIRDVISLPEGHNLIPILGWSGVVALFGFAIYATSNLKTTILGVSLLVGCGLLGVWTQTADTLALTIAAVILSVAIGLPLGVWAGISNRALAALTPILDFAQIMPTFVYLTPLALIFLIGPASATIATMVYAIPPVIRITAHGIRHVPNTVIESATSMGSTKRQILSKVQLPLARETIIVGVNQCVMAALSLVTIASLIDAPGLGKTILLALQTLNVGKGFVAGLAIVFLAIMLDRSASAAGVRARNFVPPTESQIKRRRLSVVLAGAIAFTFMYLSRTILALAVFPSRLNIGPHVENFTNSALKWAKENLYFLTDGLQNAITVTFINPLEWILSGTPWFLTIAMIVGIGFLIGGSRPALIAALSFGGIVVIGLWQDSMLTLTQVLTATVLTLLLGIALGVGVGRNATFDRIMRPILDAGQTLPAFVYMVPLLGLFGATRFTAIAAAVVYAFPVVVKLVAEGIRTVPVTMIESATASGSTSWQMITKVQLPASRKSLALAINQGLIYVLAMVVVGGLVGGGGLGYDVVNGFVQLSLVGKGLAAGLAIVFMGIGLDRISQFGAKRGSPADRI
ncbi:MAG: ABC transporter permease subunit [Actinomycetes bacterium]